MRLVDEELEVLIGRLSGMSLNELRAEWRQRLGSEPTGQGRDLLARRLAYALQVKAYGGLKPETRRRLKQLYEAFKADSEYTPLPNLGLKPGVVLTREWQGMRHQVMVLDEGFEYAGQTFASLSEVARHITGTRWSGPGFFGLRRKKEGRS
jgi:hypothetical protein